MKQRISELIALQQKTDAELRKRCAGIFESYKALAFAERDDQLFVEKWTPSSAAAPYQFQKYEINGPQITLFGMWSADCFINTISISFPTNLIDDDLAIGTFLRKQAEKNKANREKELAAVRQSRIPDDQHAER